MTPEQEQAIRALHQPEPLPEGRTDIYCLDCARLWPCDTTVVLAALDEAQSHIDALEATIAVKADRHAAREQALIEAIEDHDCMWDGNGELLRLARQHEEKDEHGSA